MSARPIVGVRTSRIGPLRGLFLLGLAAVASAAEPADSILDRLRGRDAFERQRAEVEIVRLGAEGLPALARALESSGDDRALFFRVERLFSQGIESLGGELASELNALGIDEEELRGIENRREAAAARATVDSELEKRRGEDPEFLEKVHAIVRLENLEARETRAAAGEGLALEARALEEMEKLRGLRETWRRSMPGFDEISRPFVRWVLFQASGIGDEAPGDLEDLRAAELRQRIAERKPRIEELTRRVEALGLAAANAILARVAIGSPRSWRVLRPLAIGVMEKAQAGLILPDESFDPLGYARGVLWAVEVDRRGPEAARAQAALERHLALAARDSSRGDALARERAEDELYFLGARGLAAVEGALGSAGNASPPGMDFLRGLLRLRIRPRTYARTGIDLADYASLDFHDRRRAVFDYARTAGEESLPTLRALVSDDALEKSFFVKLAAAKALAGFRDMWGYNYLLVTHPDMTLKKPEVSRELLVAQGAEYIREKNYTRAVEELRRLLDEHPFDFRGNYHIAFAYLLLKNYAKAIHHFEVARRVSPKDQLTLYNLACALALAGKKAEAVGALEDAVEAGFDDGQHVEEDPDLESIREEPGYRRLLERLGSVRESSPSAPSRKAD